MASKKIFSRQIFVIFAVFAVIIFSLGKTDLGKKIIPTANASWENLGGSTSIYPGPNNGTNPSMAVDTLGRPHVVWQDHSSGHYDLYYLYWDGAAWVDADGVGQESINMSNQPIDSLEPSLVLDANNRPHILWHQKMALPGECDLYYLYWDGVAWVDVDGVGQGNILAYFSPSSCAQPSLALNSGNGRPSIAWSDRTTGNYDIYYLYWNGAAWVDADGVGQGNIDIYPDALTSEYPSLILDNTNQPRIAWMDQSTGNYDIYYLYWNGAVWVDADGVGQGNIDIYPSVLFSSSKPSLALDDTNKPHIAWFYFDNADPNVSDIYYLYWNGAVWVDVDGVGQGNIDIYLHAGISTSPSLALDNTNKPHVAWLDTEPGVYNVYYLYWNGVAWVDADGVGQGNINISGDGVAAVPVLGLDNTGAPRIAWSNFFAPGIYNIYFTYWGNPIVATKLLIAAEGQTVAGGGATPTNPVTISGSPSDQIAGTQSGNFYIYAVDNANNLDVTKNSAVVLNSTDPAIVFNPAGINLVAGIGSFRATFNTVGNRTVAASVVGLIPVISSVINVRSNIPYQPPVQPPGSELKADISALDQAIVGERVFFDGSQSIGDINIYSWDFGDGGEDNGVITSHSFSKAGFYEVILVVQDASGQTATATHWIRIVSNEEIPIYTPPNPQSPVTPITTEPPSQAVHNFIEKIVSPLNLPLGILTAIIVWAATIVGLFTSVVPGMPALFSTFWQEIVRLYLAFLQLIGLHRRRRPWGVVYDSQTKQPIEKALVQIFEGEFGRFKDRVFTDKEGRFGFLVGEGRYNLSVSKWGYAFPSRMVVGVVDAGYENIYQQQPLEISGKGGYLALNIPLDQQELTIRQSFHYSFIYKVLKFLHILHLPLLIFGSSVAILGFLIIQSLTNELILIVYLLFWFLEIIQHFKTRGYGTVKDLQTHKPLGLAILRLFDANGIKLLKTTVTDYLGRYNFFVEKGGYLLRAEKPGYEPYSLQKDLVDKEKIVRDDISLRPTNVLIGTNCTNIRNISNY